MEKKWEGDGNWYTPTFWDKATPLSVTSVILVPSSGVSLV